MNDDEAVGTTDQVAAHMAAFFEEKYGPDMGPTVYLNLMDALKPFELDGDIILGTHQLEVFINADTGEVEITKTRDDDEDEEETA